MGATSDATDFDTLAGVYERIAETSTQPLAIRALDLLGIEPGQSLIDVAAGMGAAAAVAAERGARVLAIDIAPAMIARASERLRLFEGCEAKVMSFDALEVPDAQFDAAVSNVGILAFSTWRKGLDEIVRVTRPGGRIAVTVWTERTDATPASVMRRVFAARFPGRELWPKDFFPSWSSERLGEALRVAGCDDVEIRICHTEWRPKSADGRPLFPADILDEGDPMFRNFPGYAALTSEEREQLRAPLAEAFASHAGSDGSMRLTTEAFVAVARRRQLTSAQGRVGLPKA